MQLLNTDFLQRYRIGYFFYVVFVVVLYLISYLVPSLPFFIYIPLMFAWVPMVWVAVRDLKKKKIGNEFFLVFATIFSFIGREEQAIMIVLIIMLCAHYAELIVEQRTHDALKSLVKLIPTEVTIQVKDKDKIVPLSDVRPGMDVIVKTGGRIPVDGIVINGVATINESALTGESRPLQKDLNSHVFAGTFVEAGSIIIKVEKVQDETLFGRISALLVEAEQERSHIALLAEKILYIFTPLYLLFIVLVWLLTRNFDTVLTLFIFGSPLELALVTPLTVLAGIVAGFRNGVLIKSGRALELLGHVDTVIFDKTGTLTLGKPRIVHVMSYVSDMTDEQILFIAAVAEKYSDHVVAKALADIMHEKEVEVPAPDEYHSVVGHGVEVEYNKKTYFFGNQHFTEAPEHGGSPMPSNREACFAEKSHSVFYLSSNGVVLGKVCMADTIRPDAPDVIKKLRESGVKRLILLSGDRQEITQTIAEQLSIQEYYGDMFPDQKLAMVKNIQEKRSTIAMVGDGINDVAALRQADVGIAMGAMGMEPAIDAADIVLMTDKLHMIFFVRKLAQKVFKVIKQNLIIGFLLLHALGTILTLMHFLTPFQAALAHSIADIFILINASRLISFQCKE